MDTFTFDSIEEFCEMLDDVFSDTKESVSVIAKYHDAKEIIKELVLYGYDFGYINLDYEYPNEYEVMIINDRIYCDKLKRDGEYITSWATAIYAMEDVNSKCILRSYPDADKVFIVEFEDYGTDDDSEDESDDASVDMIKDDDGCVHGFTLSSSDGDRYVTHSFYSTDMLDTVKMMDMLSDIWNL